jgi:membrane protein DedA with SNARE-associated domain
MKNENKDNKLDFMAAYSKYFSMTLQMIVLIVLGAFGGKALDMYFKLETHVFSIVLIILATLLAFYLFFKTILSKK